MMKKTRTMMKQRVLGILLLFLCALILYLNVQEASLEYCDNTPVVLLAPMGLWLLFSKERLI